MTTDSRWCGVEEVVGWSCGRVVRAIVVDDDVIVAVGCVVVGAAHEHRLQLLCLVGLLLMLLMLQ